MDLDLISDKATLMDFDILFHDDSTSCSSSLSVPLFGEDIDDLRLGAEANMFAPRFDDDTSSRRNPVQNFVIAKERKESADNDLDYTYSTISSIPDLIDAREGNPEDLLFSLGFASFEGEESHSSILSRFNSPPELSRNHHSRNRPHNENAKESEIVLDTRDSIVKTQEWLDNHPDVNESSNVLSTPKEATGGSKVAGNAQSQGKRLPAQKKRLRWSRSRQSSFDLLPNLEEEEVPPKVESDSYTESLKDNSKLIAPIRESSQEKEEFAPKFNEEVKVTSIIPDPDTLNEQLCKLEKQRSCDKISLDHPAKSCNCNQDTEQSGTSVLTETTQSVLSNSIDKVKQSSEVSNDPSLHFSPLKRLNLLSMKVDSFELEEIISNDGRGSPNILKPPRQSVSPDVTNPSRMVRLPQSDSVLDSEGTKSTSSLASSDSSSGFDEGPEDLTPSIARNNSTNSNMEICEVDNLEKFTNMKLPKWAEDLSTSLCTTKTSELVKNPRQKIESFCAQRANIACASGIAEYTLLWAKERRKLENFKDHDCQSVCMTRSTSSLSSSNKDQDISHKNRTFSLNERQSVSCRCECETHDQSQRLSPQFKTRRRQVPLASQSFPDIDNANNSNNFKSKIERRLLRISSMPSLHLPSLSRYRKTPCQSNISDARGPSTSSLMSSISDVTYLSYRSTSKKGNSNEGKKRSAQKNGTLFDRDMRQHSGYSEISVHRLGLNSPVNGKCPVDSSLGSDLSPAFSDSENGTAPVLQESKIVCNHVCKNRKSNEVSIMDMMQKRSFEHLSQS